MAREQTGDELGVENSVGSGHIVLKTSGFQLSVHFYIILPATLKWRAQWLCGLQR
jgi:hypothetical protein